MGEPAEALDSGLGVERKRILIIDDEPDTIAVLSLRLQAKGYHIITGLDGFEGIIKARQRKPDLIVVDAMMPRMDGREFVRLIKESEDYAMIPLMILTARSDLRESFTALGCDSFLTKPYDAERVIQEVEALLRKDVLIAGDYRDYTEHIKAAFGPEEYDVASVEDLREALQRLTERRYHLAVIRLAQVEDTPREFMEKVRMHSRNKQIQILIYSDAYVPGTETGNYNVIEQNAVAWVKAGNVLFYDPRITKSSISNFLNKRS